MGGARACEAFEEGDKEESVQALDDQRDTGQSNPIPSSSLRSVTPYLVCVYM